MVTFSTAIPGWSAGLDQQHLFQAHAPARPHPLSHPIAARMANPAGAPGTSGSRLSSKPMKPRQTPNRYSRLWAMPSLAGPLKHHTGPAPDPRIGMPASDYSSLHAISGEGVSGTGSATEPGVKKPVFRKAWQLPEKSRLIRHAVRARPAASCCRPCWPCRSSRSHGPSRWCG